MQQVDLAADAAGCDLVQTAAPIFLDMVGAQVGEGRTGVVFYFGSSAGSAKKDILLAQSPAIK
jgi:hypothetical protein